MPTTSFAFRVSLICAGLSMPYYGLGRVVGDFLQVRHLGRLVVPGWTHHASKLRAAVKNLQSMHRIQCYIFPQHSIIMHWFGECFLRKRLSQRVQEMLPGIGTELFR